MTGLTGRSAVVTGGGSGIGAAVAEALADAGASVVVAGRSAERIAAAAGRLEERGGRAFAVRCDVTDEASVQALAERARAHLGAVDILVNNAGVASAAPLRDVTLQEWHRVFAVNATGTFLCTRAFVPDMVTRGWGRVINIASVAGRQGARYISAYAASKHAVVGFTRSVAAEVASHAVTVNAICPGYVDTPMTEESVARIVDHTGRSEAEALEAILAATPQHRLLTPHEVAELAVVLCGDGARSITGQAIVMDGGGLLA